MWFPRSVRAFPASLRLLFPALLVSLGLAIASSQERIPGEMTKPIPAPPSLRGVPGVARVAAPVPSGPRERIRPEFLPGQTYRFVSRTELRSALGEADFEQQVRFDAKVRIDGKDGIVLRARTERIDASFRSGARTLAYESLNPADQETPMGRHFKAFLNRTVEFTLDPDLRVDSAKEDGRESPESLLPGVPKFGPDEIGQLLASIPQGFPTRAVAPGEVWTLSGNRPVGELGSLDFTLDYRFGGPVSFEGSTCLLIELGGTLAGALPIAIPSEEVGAFAAAQGYEIRGRLLFDPLDKMLRFSEQSLELQLSLPAPEGGEPQILPASQKTTVRLLHVIPTS